MKKEKQIPDTEQNAQKFEETAEVKEISTEANQDCAETISQKDDEIKALREEAARARADYYNLRMRVERDHERDMKYAAERAVTSLLPVYENLTRVTASISDKEDVLIKGISMVEQQFMEILKQLGLEEIPTEGKFDPSVHEAIMLEPVDEDDKDGVITEVFRKGYKLGGRVLKAAQVKVGKKEK